MGQREYAAGTGTLPQPTGGGQKQAAESKPRHLVKASPLARALARAAALPVEANPMARRRNRATKQDSNSTQREKHDSN